MSLKSFLASIPNTQPGEVIEHPASDPRDIEDVKRIRDEALAEAYAKRRELIPQINETRKKLGAWVSCHGVSGEPKLETEE